LPVAVQSDCAVQWVTWGVDGASLEQLQRYVSKQVWQTEDRLLGKQGINRGPLGGASLLAALFS